MVYLTDGEMVKIKNKVKECWRDDTIAGKMEFHPSTAIMEDQSRLWHQRFVHLHFRSLSLLNMKRVVHYLLSIEQPKKLCEGSLLSKQTRNSFKSKIPAAKTPSEVIY